MTVLDDQPRERPTDGIRGDSEHVHGGLDAETDAALARPQRGLFARDWNKALVVLLTLLAGVAVLSVIWQIVSPLVHTLVLFALAAVLAFALSGPVGMLTPRLRSRLVAIVVTYLVVGIVVVGGLTLIAGPFVRQATDLAAALPQYATDLHAPDREPARALYVPLHTWIMRRGQGQRSGEHRARIRTGPGCQT